MHSTVLSHTIQQEGDEKVVYGEHSLSSGLIRRHPEPRGPSQFTFSSYFPNFQAQKVNSTAFD